MIWFLALLVGAELLALVLLFQVVAHRRARFQEVAKELGLSARERTWSGLPVLEGERLGVRFRIEPWRIRSFVFPDGVRATLGRFERLHYGLDLDAALARSLLAILEADATPPDHSETVYVPDTPELPSTGG